MQQSSEGYTYAQLSYVMLYGINLTNPRLCRRDSNGAVTCGSSAALGSDAWILYTPGGGSSYDDAFLSINVGTGVSLVKRYAGCMDQLMTSGNARGNGENPMKRFACWASCVGIASAVALAFFRLPTRGEIEQLREQVAALQAQVTRSTDNVGSKVRRPGDGHVTVRG